MSWMKMLCEVYDNNEELVANYVNEAGPICPVSHLEVNAQIKITLDKDGNFQSAAVIDESEMEIIIPVTEESAGRSSGDAPHPLCDNLTYTAGDYKDYAASSKEAASAERRFTKYLDTLTQWKDSPFSHEKVKAVYQYVCKNRMIKDLVQAGIVKLDDAGKLSKEKINKRAYDKCIVCFRIISSEQTADCWKDKTLIESYQKYYQNGKQQAAKTDICYITGRADDITENHPKGILASSYGAKLVSANDSSDFTYRGRFTDGGQAYAVSYEVSQKAHSALRWLAKRQGFIIGMKDKRTYICWSSSGKPLPPIDWLDYGTEPSDVKPTTKLGYKKKLKAYIEGYRRDFTESDDVVIMALEAATTGRLSVVYYSEFKAAAFLDRIESWYENLYWTYTKFQDGRAVHQFVAAPTLKQIVLYAFGIQQNKMMKVNDKLLIKEYQRLFHCVAEAKPLPADIVNAIFKKAGNLQAYTTENREKLLFAACALIAKDYKDKEKGELDMNVDRSIFDASYLYGRLLAVYERIERSTYDDGEKREPNAIRYQSVFVQRPGVTRMTLEQKIIPYLQKLPVATREFYRTEMEEISNMIKWGELNQPLGYLYLVGYYAERADLKLFKNNIEALKTEIEKTSENAEEE